MCVCTRAHVHVRSRVQGQLWSWFSPSTMGSGNQTRVFSLGSKCLYPLSKNRIAKPLLWDWFFFLYPISRDLPILDLSPEFSVSCLLQRNVQTPTVTALSCCWAKASLHWKRFYRLRIGQHGGAIIIWAGWHEPLLSWWHQEFVIAGCGAHVFIPAFSRQRQFDLWI